VFKVCFSPTLQIGNLDGYYHFQLTEFNSSLHGEILAGHNPDGITPENNYPRKSVNSSSLLWSTLGAALQQLQHTLTLALNNEQHVSL
jgi:hypothetical protein